MSGNKLYGDTGHVAEVTDENRLKVESLAVGQSVNKGDYINVHLRDNGNKDLNVNGSITPVEFSAGPPAGKKWFIARMIIVMEDNSMNWKKFAGISGGLTNGLDIEYSEGGVMKDLLDGEPIKTNLDFIEQCYDTEIDSENTDIIRVRWTFSKSGTFLQMNNTHADKMLIRVNDNLSSVDYFHVRIQGYEEDEV